MWLLFIKDGGGPKPWCLIPLWKFVHCLWFYNFILTNLNKKYHQDSHSVKTFSSNLKSSGWILLSTDVHYLDLGNTSAGSCCVITAIHSSCSSTVEPLLLKRAPIVTLSPLGEFVCELFNWQEHAILPAWDDADFAKQDTQLKASTPDSPLNNARGVLVWFSLHCPDTDDSVTLGSESISVDGLCPAFNACPNPNIFQQYFGIEFHHEGHTYIQVISSYKFFRCFGLIYQITHRLSHSTYEFALDSAMPACTSVWLLEQVHVYFGIPLPCKQWDLFAKPICCPCHY